MPPAAVRPAPARARLYGALIALPALAGLAAWLYTYPLAPLLAGVLLTAYMLAVARWPGLWLTLLPAFWPVVDLAPWSGHIYATESDALLLATLAALGLHETIAAQPTSRTGTTPVRLTPGALLSFSLLAASVGISGAHGLQGISNTDLGDLISYASPLNALRVGKGFVLAFLLIPFLHLSIRREGESALTRFTLGMTLGLLSCSLAALWERISFPGFTNFSADYRSSALFWEMHVGGALLDAWLAMTLPFALLLTTHRHPALRIVAAVASTLGIYAIFTTFSRIVYAAVGLSLLIMFGMQLLSRHPARQGVPRLHMLPTLLLAGLVVAGCLGSFSGGGYRGLAAFVGLVLLGHQGGGVIHRMSPGPLLAGTLAGIALLALTPLAQFWLPKGVYLTYALAAGCTAVVLLLQRRHAQSPVLVFALLTWTAGNAAWIGAYWGGPTALPGAALAAGGALAVLLCQARLAHPLWLPSSLPLPTVLAFTTIGGLGVATLTSSYMGERMAMNNQDLNGRMAHFRASVNMIHSPLEQAFGLGLGRFPEAFFWNLPDEGLPGTVHLHRDETGRQLELGGARHTIGFGEELRVSQRVATDATLPFRFRLKAKTQQDASLAISLCRKHLLYSEACTTRPFTVKGAGDWQTIEGTSAPGNFPPGFPPRPAVVSLSLSSPGRVLVDELEVMAADGRSLIANGDFEHGVDRWFMTSDRDHLPWHAKNLLVHLYVEQGWLGIIALLTAAAFSGLRLLRSASRATPFARALMGGLSGLMAVGMVDSLLDMPRLSVFVCLVLWLGLTFRPSPPRQSPS